MSAPRHAVAWAREALAAHGRRQSDGSWVIPLSQARLSEESGFARGSGTIASYLTALGPAVRRRRRGIVLDEAELAALEKATNGADFRLSPRTAQVARDLALRLGRPTPYGTALLVSEGHRTRPATLADMAAVLCLARSVVHRHVSRLRAAGRLRRRGTTWVFVHDPDSRLGHSPTTAPSSPRTGAELGEIVSCLHVGLTSIARFLDAARTQLTVIDGGTLPEADAAIAAIDNLHHEVVDALTRVGSPRPGRPKTGSPRAER